MKKELIVQLHKDFEKIVRIDAETGVEFWTARDLQPVLGYSRWENFVKVIEKAKTLVSQQVTTRLTIFLISRKWWTWDQVPSANWMTLR